MSVVPWKNKRPGSDSEQPEATTSLRSELQRLVESVWRDPLRWAGESLGATTAWRPSVEMTESDDEVVVRAEVAGVDPNDIDVTLAARQLTISGEKRDSAESDRSGSHITERSYGSFRRTLTLPEAVDTSRIDARCKDGVLTVRIKKTSAATPKRIEVKSQ